jgi:dTDP-4-amino-4,6-dideoxygalactose transaminase
MYIDLTRKDLAINGGEPIRKNPWSENLIYGDEEKKAALKSIETGLLSLFEASHSPLEPFSFWGGPFVQRLEKDWCDYYKVKYSISVNSATSGLYAAIGALDIGYGDEVITSPYTMTACATAALVYGAIPIFADVQLETGCIDPDSVESLVTERTKAILVVHQFGIPADMDQIMEIAKKYNLKVIEDCAQAHGAKYKGQFVGTFGDIGVFSLNVNKTIQTGEGGVCVTNDDGLRYRLALIRNHGEAVVEAAGYGNISNIVGFNYRLTEIQAAIAIEQLKKLDDLNKIRIEYVNYLSDKLSKYGCFKPMTMCYNKTYNKCDCVEGSDCLPTYYVFCLRFFKEMAGISREEFLNALKAEGIPIFFAGYTRPLYLLPLYQQKICFKNGYPFSAKENQNVKTNYYLGACPNAEKLFYEEFIGCEHIRFPHTSGDMDDIAKAINKLIHGE